MIEVNNLTGFRVDEKFLKKLAQKVLASERKNKTELSIALVGLKRIKELNKKYRKKDRITDTLSFTYNNSGQPAKLREALLAGEIVICPQEVKKNAKRFDSTFKKELTRVLIHGILHLLGYDHEGSEKEAEKMRKKEEYYFSKILNSKF
jgi:probable rRNA maturation factor